MGYDRQLILLLSKGSPDGALVAQAEALNQKKREKMVPSEVVALTISDPSEPNISATEALREANLGKRSVPQPMTNHSRLYLLGEGNPENRTVAGINARNMATLLATAGLKGVKVISIVADGAARDVDRPEEHQLDPDAHSFASELLMSLKQDSGLNTIVQARVERVIVSTDPNSDHVATGRKLTAPLKEEGNPLHKKTRSKIRFSWDGSKAVREWCY